MVVFVVATINGAQPEVGFIVNDGTGGGTTHKTVVVESTPQWPPVIILIV